MAETTADPALPEAGDRAPDAAALRGGRHPRRGDLRAGGEGGLADTAVLLLPCVFAMVNVAVLVPRRDPVARGRFRAPGRMPALGAVVCLVLALPVTGRGADVYARAGLLPAIGALLRLVNRLVPGGGGGLRPGSERQPSPRGQNGSRRLGVRTAAVALRACGGRAGRGAEAVEASG
ncbi:hypothetical protein [Planomonospora sp. ID82291]|uniref:hypothetical protein n=1 Tax=Planomonospora sp. ID82291 TaxID=2738136 RepID=UPI0018C42A55|nr:hypothetical protein [Planomonospora sp. ID82291]MBG0815639.1 hypothetical protein [Planomonospora sp. ID82291]